MSNATTLQTNNNKLSANNTDLANILTTINNLPEAGSGGGSGGATPHNITSFNTTGNLLFPPQGYAGQELIFTLKDSPYSNPLVFYGEDGLINPTILDQYSYSTGSAILAHFVVYSFIMPDADVDIFT